MSLTRCQMCDYPYSRESRVKVMIRGCGKILCTACYWRDKYIADEKAFFGAWLQRCHNVHVYHDEEIDADAVRAADYLLCNDIDVSKCVDYDDVMEAVKNQITRIPYAISEHIAAAHDSFVEETT